MSCYTEFHWTPEVVRALPESEAILLAVYFEEVGRLRKKQADAASSGGGNSNGTGWRDDLVVDGDDDDDEEESDA